MSSTKMKGGDKHAKAPTSPRTALRLIHEQAGELDPSTAWLYQPRTITALLVGAGILVYASGALSADSSPTDTTTNAKRGVWAMMAMFGLYSILQAPPTLFIRPHPAVWKLVHGVAVIYLLALTFLLFQTRDDARRLLKHLHPDLGVELPERSYGEDCRIYTPEKANKFQNVYDTLFDEFVIAHILGWWAKAIMFRNHTVLWIISIGFELMELTFHHMLPNFNECWWDSWLLDVLFCNWLGIWMGMQTVKFFKGQTYEWIGLSRQPSLLAKIHRSLGQFWPASWDRDEWDPFSGPQQFLEVLAMCAADLVVEVNAFFLKFCLWVPPRNPLNSYRLLLWWLMANPSVREYNAFISSRDPQRKLGAMCWLTVAIAILEVLVEVKFAKGLYTEPMPRPIVYGWTFAAVALVVGLVFWVIHDARSKARTEELLIEEEEQRQKRE